MNEQLFGEHCGLCPQPDACMYTTHEESRACCYLRLSHAVPDSSLMLVSLKTLQ